MASSFHEVWEDAQEPPSVADHCEADGHRYHGDDSGRGRCYCGAKQYPLGGPCVCSPRAEDDTHDECPRVEECYANWLEARDADRGSPKPRVRHSGPETKFGVLCLSGEHERVD